MASNNYNLDQSDLYQVLGASESSATQTSIINALYNSGFYPRPGISVNTDVQNDSGPVSVDLTTEQPGSVGFFLEEGNNTTISITNSFGSVVATGDGANIKVNDLAGDDTVVGGAGPDTLIGGANSYLMAGGGKTLLQAGPSGPDTLQGGLGSDTIDVSMSAFDNTIIGGKGSDTITAGTGHDTIYGVSGNDSVSATTGSTTIYTGSGQETINAVGGVDTIYVGYPTAYSTGSGGAETINAGGQSSTTIAINANYTHGGLHPTAPITANGNTYVTFSNGSVTTNVEIQGHATLEYLNDTIKI